jgi:hypothetical protein
LSLCGPYGATFLPAGGASFGQGLLGLDRKRLQWVDASGICRGAHCAGDVAERLKAAVC